jgi:hypothetical protein
VWNRADMTSPGRGRLNFVSAWVIGHNLLIIPAQSEPLEKMQSEKMVLDSLRLCTVLQESREVSLSHSVSRE